MVCLEWDIFLFIFVYVPVWINIFEEKNCGAAFLKLPNYDSELINVETIQ